METVGAMIESKVKTLADLTAADWNRLAGGIVVYDVATAQIVEEVLAGSTPTVPKDGLVSLYHVPA